MKWDDLKLVGIAWSLARAGSGYNKLLICQARIAFAPTASSRVQGKIVDCDLQDPVLRDTIQILPDTWVLHISCSLAS